MTYRVFAEDHWTRTVREWGIATAENGHWGHSRHLRVYTLNLARGWATEEFGRFVWSDYLRRALTEMFLSLHFTCDNCKLSRRGRISISNTSKTPPVFSRFAWRRNQLQESLRRCFLFLDPLLHHRTLSIMFYMGFSSSLLGWWKHCIIQWTFRSHGGSLHVRTTQMIA